MNSDEVRKIVDQMHKEKNIPKEVIFSGIEAALQQATERHLGEEEEEVSVQINRFTCEITARRGEQVIDAAQMDKIIASMGRIIAQSVKQMMIQKMREAECESQFTEFSTQKGRLVTGTIQRIDAGTAVVTLSNGKSEAILPRSEQIPGESHHVNERIKAVVLDVRKAGQRVKVVLSRCHPDFVRCLFEEEIPEIADRTIDIRAVSREAGYRSKIAVSSIDMKVDCVGACVGVRGSRIKNIIDELGGERIDIVRWNDSLQVMIPNALQPAQIEDVFLYPRLGRAIVLVQEDQLSLAIGRRGQNVRLASKLVGWDIEIMTTDELTDGIGRAEGWFAQIPGMAPEMVEMLIEEGFLSYDDLTFLEPAQLAEMAGITEDDAEEMIAYAEEAAENLPAEEAAPASSERSSPREVTPSVATLFAPDDTPSRSAEPKPTLESLFGPEPEGPPPEPTVDPMQVFGEPAEAGQAAEGEPVKADPAH